MDVKGKSKRTGLGSTAPQSSWGRAGEEEEEVVTEAQQQLKTLLKKQLDISAGSVRSLLEHQGQKQFSPVVASYHPLGREVRGLLSLDQYRASEEDYSRVDRLRHMGLTQQEIELELEEEGCVAGPKEKKKRYGPDPVAHEDRMRAIHQKMGECDKRMEEPIIYSGVKQMSRHALELERSLFRGVSGGTASSLQHLAVADTNKSNRSNMAYPSQIMPDPTQDWKPCKKACSKDQEETSTTSPVTHPPSPLPIQVIERNRLSLAEILVLPRFRSYTPGPPSNVLYVKNLHPKVSVDDLRAIFGHFYSRGKGEEEWPHIRLMTGRMKGQAFVAFNDITTATKALELVNGYLVQERPLIISYGRGQ